MTSVERILQYTDLDQEAPAHYDDVQVPPDWPNEGAITFQHVTLQYLQDTLPALCNVDFTIRGGEKVVWPHNVLMYLCLYPVIASIAIASTFNTGLRLLSPFKCGLNSKVNVTPWSGWYSWTHRGRQKFSCRCTDAAAWTTWLHMDWWDWRHRYWTRRSATEHICYSARPCSIHWHSEIQPRSFFFFFGWPALDSSSRGIWSLCIIHIAI